MGNGRGYISSLEDLKAWFEHAGETRWNLYRGFKDRMANAWVLARQEQDDMPLEESWALLQNMIKISSKEGGQFTIYLPKKNGWVTRVNLVNPVGDASLGALPSPYMAGMVTKDEIQKEIEREREKWELQRRLEDMEAALAGHQSTADKVIGFIKENIDLNPILKMVTGAMVTKGNPELAKQMQVSIQGNPESDDQAAQQGYEYDGNRVVHTLNRMRPFFQTDEDFYNYLERVGQFFEKNPQMSVAFFSNDPNVSNE